MPVPVSSKGKNPDILPLDCKKSAHNTDVDRLGWVPSKTMTILSKVEQSGLPSCLEDAEETGIGHDAGTTEGAFTRRRHNVIRAIATHRQMTAKPRDDH
jgi:hypothetical protein